MDSQLNLFYMTVSQALNAGHLTVGEDGKVYAGEQCLGPFEEARDTPGETTPEQVWYPSGWSRETVGWCSARRSYDVEQMRQELLSSGNDLDLEMAREIPEFWLMDWEAETPEKTTRTPEQVQADGAQFNHFLGQQMVSTGLYDGMDAYERLTYRAKPSYTAGIERLDFDDWAPRPGVGYSGTNEPKVAVCYSFDQACWPAHSDDLLAQVVAEWIRVTRKAGYIWDRSKNTTEWV